MSEERKNDLKYILLLILISSFFYVSHLGQGTLWDTDETLYTRIAQEMHLTGDYMVTQWNGIPWFCHPPGYYWLVVLSSKIFGWNTFAARFPSAVFSILTVLLVYSLAKIFFNKKVALYSGLIFITMTQTMMQARLAMLDMAFLFFIVLAVYLFIKGEKDEKTLLNIGFWASCGFAVIVKGPVGVIIPLFYAFLFAFTQKRWDGFSRMIKSPGVMLFLFISIPWFYGMADIFGKEFIDQVFGYFFFARIYKPVMHQSGPYYYYLPVFIVGTLPWTIFYPLMILNRNESKESKFLFLWVILTFIIFSLAGTKLPNYLIFIYPALAISLGLIMHENFYKEKYNRFIPYAFMVQSVFYLLHIPVFYFVFRKIFPAQYQTISFSLTQFMFIILISSLLIIVFTLKKKNKWVFYTLIISVFAMFFSFLNLIPVTERIRPEVAMISYINSNKIEGDKVVAFGNKGFKNSLLLYTGLPLSTYVSDKDLKCETRKNGGYFIVTPESEEKTVRSVIRNRAEKALKEGSLILFRIKEAKTGC